MNESPNTNAETAVTKKKTGKIIADVVEWTLIALFSVFLVLVIVFASHAPTGNSSGSAFGFETRLVLTSSMDAPKSFYEDKDYKIKNIKPGSLVFIKDCDYENEAKKDKFYLNLGEGDIVTYYSNLTNVYVTHRITSVYQQSGETVYTLNGDNVDAETSIPESVRKSDNLIVGKVVGKSAALGWFYTNIVSKKAAMWCLIALPCFLVAGYETVKVVLIVSKDRKEKQAAEKKMQEDKISSLQKQIEELKNSRPASDEKEADRENHD